MKEKKYLIATYGSLRKGKGNHHIIGNSKFLGTFQTDPKFDMYSIGDSFPGIIKNGTTSIIAEVYEVDEKTLYRVNKLEGYTPEGKNNNFYDREVIKTPYGNAYIYIYQSDVKHLNKVLSGDWVSYLKQRKLMKQLS